MQTLTPPLLPTARWALLGLLFLGVSAYQVGLSREVVEILSGTAARAEAPFGLDRTSPRIQWVSPAAEEAGLRPGDMVVSVDHSLVSGAAVVERSLAAHRTGDDWALTVRHPGMEPVTLTVALMGTSPGRSPGGARAALLVVLGLLMPWLCLGTGFWVATVRSRDPLAWLLLALMLSVGVFGMRLVGITPSRWPFPWRSPALAYRQLLFLTWPLWMFVFGLRFPERSSWDVRWPWVKWVLIAPLVVQALLLTLGDVAQSESFELAARVRPFQPPDGVVIGLLMLGVALFFLQIGIKSGVAAADARRRLRLLHFGTAMSMTPCFLLLVSSLALRGSTDFENLPGWLVLPSLATLFLFPLTMAYVIVVERAMDVRVVIRQGVRYALARGGVRALRMATTVALIAAAMSLWENPQASPAIKVAIILAAAAVSKLNTQFTGRLAGAVDRRFFRETYEAERLLGDLAENVRSIVETEALLLTVAETISSALHIPLVAAFLESDGLFRPALALGYVGKPGVSLSGRGATVEKLRRDPAPLPVGGHGPRSWGGQSPEKDVAEGDALHRLGAELLLPLSTKDRLLGFVSLGPKLSEEPYSSGDERLLRSVAAQTGLALENSRLAEAIAREVAQRERQRRELEIAREVQEQLFPQRQPSAPGFDYCGACRPARHVGGDYYDFIALPEEVVGIAIGDVSGKGIPAALLMAGLQASLRAQAPLRTLDLPGLVTAINRLLYDLSAANRYATFFYAQLDTRRRTLTYVNAGHNPPMLLRNGEVLRLDVGGPAVGLLPETSYEKGSLTLERGDLLVAYTDGVSEAMSPAEEEWGEERLVAALRANTRRTVADVVMAVMAAADAFASGAPQHDDMTLVVVRAADHWSEPI